MRHGGRKGRGSRRQSRVRGVATSMCARGTRSSRLILDLCGGTGAWSLPYKEAGYRVVVVDPAAGGADVRELMYRRGVHGVLAAPPCAKLCRASARYWRSWGRGPLLDALAVVDACLRIVIATEPEWWALENPPGRLKRYLGPPAYQFQPCDFGDPWTKQTFLWGRFTRPVRGPTVRPLYSLVRRVQSRAKRAQTPAGFARAFFAANP